MCVSSEGVDQGSYLLVEVLLFGKVAHVFHSSAVLFLHYCCCSLSEYLQFLYNSQVDLQGGSSLEGVAGVVVVPHFDLQFGDFVEGFGSGLP